MELILALFGLALGFVIGVLYAAWRLKGERTMLDSVVEIMGGGGPGPVKPK